MESLCSKRLDTWLAIGQKIAVIAGLIVSGWFFLIREEASPHVRLEIDSAMMPGCVVNVIVTIENLGGRVWNLHSAVTRLYQPNLDRRPSLTDLARLEVGTQIRQLKGKLLIGESTAIGFNIEPSAKPKRSFLVVQTAIHIREENQKWIRVQEDSVLATDCE